MRAKNLIRALLVALALPFALQATIKDIYNIGELQEHVHPEALVIFDLDNTVFESSYHFGGDQWFRQRVKDHIAEGCSKEEASNRTLAEWTSVQGVIQMKLVEEDAKHLIEDLQKEGLLVMGLTTRGMETSLVTLNHLKNLGVEFHVTAPYDSEHVFMNGPRGVVFRQGVLFTGNTNKGDALWGFLEHAQVDPKHVIFINDKASNIQEVADSCYERKVPFLGLRYGYLDEKVANYDHAQAQKQYTHLSSSLSEHIFHDLVADSESVQ